MNELIKYFNKYYSKEYGKIQYPRTDIQMYRVYQSIKSYGIDDEELNKLLHDTILPKPKSTEEKELYADCFYNVDDSKLVTKEYVDSIINIGQGSSDYATKKYVDDSIKPKDYIEFEETIFTIPASVIQEAYDNKKVNSVYINFDLPEFEVKRNAYNDEDYFPCLDTPLKYYITFAGEKAHGNGYNTMSATCVQNDKISLFSDINGERYGSINCTKVDMTNITDLILTLETKVKYSDLLDIQSNYGIPYVRLALDKIYVNGTPTENAHLTNKEYVDNKVANLVNSAPKTLDTLNELASALGNDANFATTVTNSLANKADKEHTHSQYLTEHQSLNGYAPLKSPSFTDSISMGRESGSSIGTNSVAMGESLRATGNYSHAEGSGNKSTGNASHSEGIGNNASGSASHAEGYQTTASGNYSHAQGQQTTALGDFSHAEGMGTRAEKDASHAEGIGSRALAVYSHAEGAQTMATGTCSHVQGKYNIADTKEKYAHIVGNGMSDSNRSNAHTLDWNGNTWYKGNVYIGGTGQDDVNAKILATEEYVNNAIQNVSSGEVDQLTDKELINALSESNYLIPINVEITSNGIPYFMNRVDIIDKNENNIYIEDVSHWYYPHINEDIYITQSIMDNGLKINIRHEPNDAYDYLETIKMDNVTLTKNEDYEYEKTDELISITLTKVTGNIYIEFNYPTSN